VATAPKSNPPAAIKAGIINPRFMMAAPLVMGEGLSAVPVACATKQYGVTTG
jgi:hypothetical protein